LYEESEKLSTAIY